MRCRVFFVGEYARSMLVLSMPKYVRLNPVLIQRPAQERIRSRNTEQAQVPPRLQVHVPERAREEVLLPSKRVPEGVRCLRIPISHHREDLVVHDVRLPVHAMALVEHLDRIADLGEVRISHRMSHPLAEVGVEGDDVGIGRGGVDSVHQFLRLDRDRGTPVRPSSSRETTEVDLARLAMLDHLEVVERQDEDALPVSRSSSSFGRGRFDLLVIAIVVGGGGCRRHRAEEFVHPAGFVMVRSRSDRGHEEERRPADA
mmetsp:Transcript_29911/g.72248  ORF Transcript_29911/g.72248 Transcript_29911/m.72248 type:complete len:257 (-) Transcript_29911:229-999(-)